jgi:hypothetical protein
MPMISQCPHCHQALQFSPAQQEKIDSALANLKSGALKLGCPNCRQAINLKADGSLLEEGAPVAAAQPQPSAPTSVTPPAYPDISWLAQGIYTEQEVMAEVPKALVLMPSGKDRECVAKALSERGYQTEFPESANDALVQMRFSLYTAVVLHDEFDGALADSPFHRQMVAMPMDRRRSIFYVLIGKQRHTLYDLEALASSANVVVNEAEVVHFDIILKKGLQDMEALFGPYVMAIKRVAAAV